MCSKFLKNSRASEHKAGFRCFSWNPPLKRSRRSQGGNHCLVPSLGIVINASVTDEWILNAWFFDEHEMMIPEYSRLTTETGNFETSIDKSPCRWITEQNGPCSGQFLLPEGNDLEKPWWVTTWLKISHVPKACVFRKPEWEHGRPRCFHHQYLGLSQNGGAPPKLQCSLDKLFSKPIGC